MYYIYVIQNKLDLRIYVGQTVNPKRRWGDHKWLAKNKPEQYIHRAMIKHGIENFIFQVIDQTDDGYQIDIMETDWINWFKSKNKEFGYNLAPGGDVAWNRGLPSEQQPMYGKHHSKESKQRISISNTGKKKPLHSDEWKEKCSEWLHNRVVSEKTRNKIMNLNKGKNISDDTKQKMSNAHIGKKISDRTKRIMHESAMKIIESGKNKNVKLNWASVMEIREFFNSGLLTKKQLVEKYKITISTINKIIRNEIWKVL